ncbi:hypothetical protein BV20DRAFT_956971 [Pilatotrama ljubarskyi]|nr:hypothetical protein BV20DRAFT_956971 [Pilatotrama ljubarskyi]
MHGEDSRASHLHWTGTPSSGSPWVSRTHTPVSGRSSASASPALSQLDFDAVPSPSSFTAPQRHNAPPLSRRPSSLSGRPTSYPRPPSSAPHSGREPWTAEKQSRFESLVTRLTASANFSLSWVENPVWLTICDEFMPSAKPPTRRVLTSCLLPSEVRFYRAQAIARTAGAEATLQGDGWTGINNHHLIAFMITAKRKVHTVQVIDSSNERKTADRFLQHIEKTLQRIREDWQVDVTAFTSDASGELQAARIALLAKYPYLIVLDYYAHQVRHNH